MRGEGRVLPKEIPQENRGMDRLFEILELLEKINNGGYMAHLMEHLKKKIKDI